MNFLYACLSFLSFLALIHNARAMPPSSLHREKRSFLPYTLGHLILRIKCADTIVNTVCAPGGTQDCPKGYRGEENRGACGFATLAHFIYSGNIAGTCCIRDTSMDNNGQTTRSPGATTASPVTTSKQPKVIVYGVPVWAGYNGLPTYGDQSSPYQQGNSALYSIEAINGKISTPLSGNAGPYQLGSRTPDFKVTEVKPGNEANGALNTRNNGAAEIHTTKAESADIPEERQNLRAVYAAAAASQPSSSSGTSTSGSNGPFFYPYPALPQPIYDNSASGGGDTSGGGGGGVSVYQSASPSTYGQQQSTTTLAPITTSAQSQSYGGGNGGGGGGGQYNIQIQTQPSSSSSSNDGLPQPPAYQQNTQYNAQKPVRVIENLSTPVRSIDDIQAF